MMTKRIKLAYMLSFKIYFTHGDGAARQADERVDVLEDDAKDAEFVSDARVGCVSDLLAALKLSSLAVLLPALRGRKRARGGSRKNGDGKKLGEHAVLLSLRLLKGLVERL